MTYSNISPSHSQCFSQTAAVWVTLSWGAVLQGQATSTWIPHRVTGPTRKPVPAWTPLSMGLQVPTRTLL